MDRIIVAGKFTTVGEMHDATGDKPREIEIQIATSFYPVAVREAKYSRESGAEVLYLIPEQELSLRMDGAHGRPLRGESGAGVDTPAPVKDEVSIRVTLGEAEYTDTDIVDFLEDFDMVSVEATQNAMERPLKTLLVTDPIDVRFRPAIKEAMRRSRWRAR